MYLDPRSIDLIVRAHYHDLSQDPRQLHHRAYYWSELPRRPRISSRICRWLGQGLIRLGLWLKNRPLDIPADT